MTVMRSETPGSKYRVHLPSQLVVSFDLYLWSYSQPDHETSGDDADVTETGVRTRLCCTYASPKT